MAEDVTLSDLLMSVTKWGNILLQNNDKDKDSTFSFIFSALFKG